MRHIPMKGGLEYDALSGWKNYYKFKPGTRKYAKRKFSRRERRMMKKELGNESLQSSQRTGNES